MFRVGHSVITRALLRPVKVILNHADLSRDTRGHTGGRYTKYGATGANLRAPDLSELSVMCPSQVKYTRTYVGATVTTIGGTRIVS